MKLRQFVIISSLSLVIALGSLACLTPAQTAEVQQAATVAFDTGTIICLVENQLADKSTLEKLCGIVDSPTNQAAVDAVIHNFQKNTALAIAAHDKQMGCAQPAAK